jgi:hypothetical protein
VTGSINDPREMAEAERLNERLVRRALSLDGTCTGEHGIGCGKIDFLLGEAVSVMCAIKKAKKAEVLLAEDSGSFTRRNRHPRDRIPL